MAHDLSLVFAVLVGLPVTLLVAALVTIDLLAILTTVRIPLSLIALVPLPPLLSGSLIHQVQNPEIMLSVLEIAFGHHPIAAAGGVPAQLQILLKQLLGRAADAQIRTIAVENVVSVERDPAPGVMAHATAATTAATTSSATAARAMVAATHAFHVHSVAVVLSRYDAVPTGIGIDCVWTT